MTDMDLPPRLAARVCPFRTSASTTTAVSTSPRSTGRGYLTAYAVACARRAASPTNRRSRSSADPAASASAATPTRRCTFKCAQWSLRLCPYLAVERHRRRGLTEQTAAPGFTQMEKADPVILAVTTGCDVELLHEPGYAPTVQFRPAPWIWATRYEYRHGRLTEVGPQPLP